MTFVNYKMGQRVSVNLEEDRTSIILTRAKVVKLLGVGMCDVEVLEGPRKGEVLRINMGRIESTTQQPKSGRARK